MRQRGRAEVEESVTVTNRGKKSFFFWVRIGRIKVKKEEKKSIKKSG